jgi:serine protease inhibitor
MVLLGLALGRCSSKESLPSVFSSWAAFSGMEETGTLFVGDVLHEAFIAVNEEET